jgi:hypothetical protein
MQVRVFGQHPHAHATPQQPYPADERKEPQLHRGILPGARLKHPRNTEEIAGEEAHAKGDGRRMQIVHPQTSHQHHQQAHIHEGGEPPSHRVAQEFQSEQGSGPAQAVLVHLSASEQARRGGGVGAHLAGFGDHTLSLHHARPVCGVVRPVRHPPAARLLVPERNTPQAGQCLLFFSRVTKWTGVCRACTRVYVRHACRM